MDFQKEFDKRMSDEFGDDRTVFRVTRWACKVLQSRLGLEIDPEDLHLSGGAVFGKVIFRSTAAGFAVEKRFDLRVMKQNPRLGGPRREWKVRNVEELNLGDEVLRVILRIFQDAGFPLRITEFLRRGRHNDVDYPSLYLEIFISGAIEEAGDVQAFLSIHLEEDLAELGLSL